MLERCPDAYCVLIRAPSSGVREQRLRARGDSEEQIRRRMELASAEEEDALGLASYVVVNDDLDGAVLDLAGIVEQIRRREQERS